MSKHVYEDVPRGLIRRHRIMVGLGSDHAGRQLRPVAVYPIVEALAKQLGAYSITRVDGYWEGVKEPGVVIEYIGDENVLVTNVARKIADALHQAEVWVTSDSTFLTKIVRKEVI